MQQRYSFIDVLRVACVTWIVGFWHLADYTSGMSGCYNSVTLRITIVILGLFFLMSGFLVGGVDTFSSMRSVFAFYRKRLARIYILYLPALIVFCILNLTTPRTAIKAALGVAMFHGPPPITLWFISALVVFYLISPLLLSSGNRMWLVAAIIWCAFALVGVLLPGADSRLALYFPAFAVGVWSRRIDYRGNIAWLGVASIAAIWISIIDLRLSPETSLLSIPLVSILPLTIFIICERVLTAPAPRSIRAIGYASFAMYLFHRPIYTLAKQFYFPVVPRSQVIYLYACFIVIIGVGWVLQKLADDALHIAILRWSEIIAHDSEA